MAERRSLAAGIEEVRGVDPEVARAFIVQEKPKPAVKSSPVRAVPDLSPAETAATPHEPQDDRPTEGAPEARAPEERGEVGRVSTSGARRPSKPTTAKPPPRPDTERLLSTLLVPVTVRLRPELAAALKRASLQRQLNGVETFTQQDIVEEALLPWLRAEGLLD